MPLKHGRTARTIRANIPANIRAERRAGRPQRQAIAIALSTAARDARKAHIRVKGVRPTLRAKPKKRSR